MIRMQRQQGFTLVEIAVVLVIIGLLLGGVLKGQELIASARVRNLADQQAGVQAAYFGFIDRYRAVPGDMDADAADTAIGLGLGAGNYVGGDANGRLEDPAGGNWDELNAVWTHLADAGFIKGNYPGNNAAPTATNGEAPLNVFSSPIILGRGDDFMNAPADRLVLHMGQNVPAEISRELDLKLDDGRPGTGSLRNSTEAATPAVYESGQNCDDGGTPAEWDINTNVQNCNPAFIF